MDETQVLAGGAHIAQAHAMEWIAQADTQHAVSIRTSRLLVRQLQKNRQPQGAAYVALGNNRTFVLQRAQACRHVWEKRKVPLLKTGIFSGETRLYALMAQMVLRQRGNVQKNNIDTVLARYAVYGTLTLQEAALIRPAVELALLEFLRPVLLEDEKDDQERKNARLFARKLKGRHASSWLKTALFYARHGGVAFAAFLQEEAKACPSHIYTQACDNTALPLGTSARRVCDLYARQRRERAELVRDIVRSLRRMAHMTNADWMQLASPAAAMLAQEPDFARQDRDTQAYIHALVARLAQKSGCTEQAVVRTARSICERNACRFCNVFLADEKRMLYHRLHLRFCHYPSPWRRRLYLLGTVGVWAVSLGLFLLFCLQNQAPWLETLGLCAFGSLMVWTMAQMCVNQLFDWCIPATFLPKLEQMPPRARTAVVLSVVIEQTEQIDAYFAALERQYCAFREAERMILLCDLPPTNTKDNAVFMPWLNHGVQTVQRYNAKGNGRYTFAVRPQRWVKGEGKCMGWDRKRGALRALNRALLGRRNELWCYGEPLPHDIQFVLTIDADTMLPAGEAQRLVCTLAHPANDRYAVAQPHMTAAASARTRSWFSRLYAGRAMDGYGSTAGRVWMQLTGYGPYAGQGLYDRAAFTEAAECIPANRFLSHALLEGALAGCAVVQDVCAVQSFPQHYTSYAKQQHRYIRGDWQWMPCAAGVQKDVHGSKLRLPWYTRLQMVDRMRLSLTALMATQLFAIGASFSRLPFALYLVLAFVPFALPFLLEAGQGIYFWCRGALAQETGRSIMPAAGRAVADVLLCAFEADIQLDAAVRASIRTWITQKHLMQWVTTGQAEKGDARTWVGYIRLMAPALVFDMLVIGFTYLQKPWLLAPTIGVCFCWTLSPLFANALDMRPAPSVWKKDAAEDLRLSARQAARLFERFGGAQRRFLMPCYVETRRGGGRKVATYTTPKTLGFALLAPLCAQCLGDTERVLALHRIARQMDALEQLPQCHGHLSERISLDSGCSATPYIRTSDSAYLCACLMVCAQAMQDWGEEALAMRMLAFARRMDFHVLYDEASGLLADGLDLRTGTWIVGQSEDGGGENDLAGCISVGRGEVPAAYLQRLARARVQGERTTPKRGDETISKLSVYGKHVSPQWTVAKAGDGHAGCGMDMAMKRQPANWIGEPARLNRHSGQKNSLQPACICKACRQGMRLAAITNVLCDACLSDWFLRNPEIAASVPLLQKEGMAQVGQQMDMFWTESLPKNERIPRYQLKKKEMYNIITH